MYRCFIAFASVFCTEIAVEKHFDPPKCDFWRGLGGLRKIFLAHYRSPYCRAPLINYAAIQPLNIITLVTITIGFGEGQPCIWDYGAV